MTTAVRWIIGALVVVVLALVARGYFAHPDPVLARHNSLVAERPHTDSIIHEHADSAVQRLKVVYVQQDRASTLAALAKQQDSLAAIAVQSHDFELAYTREKQRGDTLESALKVEKKATENALVASAFFQLAFLADSTELQRTRRDADAVAYALRVELKPRCGARCGAVIGIGFTVAAAWAVHQVVR